MSLSREPTEEHPVYAKVAEDDCGATQTFMITVHEGWRQSILCERMYGWAADWLIEQIQGKPFADNRVKAS